jgi:hypothetical protein
VANVTEANHYFKIANEVVTFYGNNSSDTALTKGTYTYEIKYTVGSDTTNSTYVTVEIKEPAGATDYSLVGDADKFDTTISASNNTTKAIAFNLYELKGGVKNSKVTANVTYKVTKDGKDISTDVQSATAADEAGIFVDNGVLTVVALGVDSNVATKLDTGVYTITATYDNTDKAVRSATLTITDGQPALTYKLVKDEVAAASASTGAVLAGNAFEFYYNGTKISTPTVKDVKGVCVGESVNSATSIKVQSLKAGDVVTFTEATITVTITGSVTYDMTVAISNGVVTVTN